MFSKRKYINNEILIVGLFFLVGIVLHFWLGNFAKSISIYIDELRYYTIARSIYLGNGLSIRGIATSYSKIAYSVLLAPFFAIEDGILRIKVINFVNSIITAGSVIPVWLICNELNLQKWTKTIIALFVILWPETVTSMTFMAETLYWPLCFIFIYMLIRNERKHTCFNATMTAFVCYLGYLTKEIFLAYFISYVTFQVLWEVYRYWINRNKGGGIETGILRARVVYTLIFIGVFISIHVILKLTIFRGFGNSYNQMGISAILAPYNFTYLFYSFFYYIAAILIVMFIVPFAYPISCFAFLPEACKKLLIFIITFFLTATATIAYTISVREDLGKVAPRIHFRYMAPGFIIILVIFLCAIESIDLLGKRGIRGKFVTITFGMTAYACILFKGVAPGSPVDQNSLNWFLNIAEKFNALIPPINDGKVFNIGVTIANIIIIMFVLLFHLLQKKNLKVACGLFIVILLFVCLEGDKRGVWKVEYDSSTDIQNIEQVILINEYFKSIDNDIDIVYVCDGLSKATKYIDTYMDRIDGFYYVDKMFLEDVFGEEYLVENVTLKESFGLGIYPKISKIDYVIIENAESAPIISLQNCSKIEEISGNLYSVYRNNSPHMISSENNYDYCFNGTDMTIFFTGDQYNALTYVASGISHKEDGFSWTDGDVMHVEIPATITSGKVDVSISVLGTFNGPKSYSVNGVDGMVSGQLDGQGTIHFTAEIIDGNISFDLNCNDAEVVNSVWVESTDARKVAFQINTITLSNNPE